MAAQPIFYSSATATQPQAAVSFCASLAARRAHGKLHFNTACPPGRATAPKKQLGACGYCSYSFQIKSLQFHKVSVPAPPHAPCPSCSTQLDITPPPTTDFTYTRAIYTRFRTYLATIYTPSRLECTSPPSILEWI